MELIDSARLKRAVSTSGKLTLSGVAQGFDAALAAAMTHAAMHPLLYVARDDAQAAMFGSALSYFAPELEVFSFPAWDCLPYDRVSPAPHISARRCATLARLAAIEEPKPMVVVTTAASLIQRVPPRDIMRRAAFSARVGSVVPTKALEDFFAINGYSRAGTVRESGEYAIRGGVIDVFPAGFTEPLRLDFFGEQLDSIRVFDPETQRSTRQLTEISLTPASEVIYDNDSVLRFRKSFVAAFGANTSGDMFYESVSSRMRRQGVDQLLPLFHEQLETLFDYIGGDAIVALDHLAPQAISERTAMASDYYAARQESFGKGAPTAKVLPPERLYIQAGELDALLAQRTVRTITPLQIAPAANILDFDIKEGRNFAPERAAGDINVFEVAAQHARALSAKGKRVIFAAWTDGSAERLTHVLHDHKLEELTPAGSWPAAAKFPPKTLCVSVLPLDHGFETDQIAIISEQDILGDRLARPRRKRKAANVIMEAGALSPGDLVVHIDHGVARYAGLMTLDVQGAPHDCLELHYAGGDKLFLPVENIELVSRYGSEDAGAALDKLGGVAWQNRKARATKRLKDMAEELIKIAAKRAAKTAEPLGTPDGAFEEFSARFPFEETDDQLAAIQDVVGDLSGGHVMDRLICGDVGFGKTEVALRAAFIAAMGGRQVAVIAPTTLLARQHYNTFVERFRGLPIRIAPLSRLVGSADAAQTRKHLENGEIEIVVGTHAVLAKDVKFRDLGLLIIDEEQHFGVKHKERLKELRSDVHVLTLSATPIPRTLQQAMSGIREMSIIATPPVDRLAVRTYVAAFDPVGVREALLREKHRGGQSFFVTPRVADLADLEKFLTEYVPEIRYVTAHGQIGARELEDIVSAFYEGKYDVLLSTTIVESGLDIPRANTLIVNRSDMFGLAQLYQLRGRVVRSKIRAYAYLLTPSDHNITPAAERRLKILQSLDGLGAGFTLASHDLDLRGGGNLLGEEQSGHIREVGVELYQSMLEEAVASLKGDETVADRSWSPQIAVGASVLIPESYVPDLTVRLSLYRRLGELESDAELDAFAAELVDRFGSLPEEAEHLIAIAGVKILCRKLGIGKLDAGPKGAVITFRDGGKVDPRRIVGLVQSHPKDFKLRPDQKLVAMGDWETPVARLRGVKGALERLTRAALQAAA